MRSSSAFVTEMCETVPVEFQDSRVGTTPTDLSLSPSRNYKMKGNES